MAGAATSIALQVLPSTPSSTPANNSHHPPSSNSQTAGPASLSIADYNSSSTLNTTVCQAHSPNTHPQSNTATPLSRWTSRLSKIFLAVAGLFATYIALSLSLWTSAKDFRDDCRSQNSTTGHITTACIKALRRPLLPPPFMSGFMASKIVQRRDTHLWQFSEPSVDITGKSLGWVQASPYPRLSPTGPQPSSLHARIFVVFLQGLPYAPCIIILVALVLAGSRTSGGASSFSFRLRLRQRPVHRLQPAPIQSSTLLVEPETWVPRALARQRCLEAVPEFSYTACLRKRQFACPPENVDNDHEEGEWLQVLRASNCDGESAVDSVETEVEASLAVAAAAESSLEPVNAKKDQMPTWRRATFVAHPYGLSVLSSVCELAYDAPPDKWKRGLLEIKADFGPDWRLTQSTITIGLTNTSIQTSKDDHSTQVSNISLWRRLPSDVHSRIFRFLTAKDVVRMSGVCRRWNTICFDTRVWDSLQWDRLARERTHEDAAFTMTTTIEVEKVPARSVVIYEGDNVPTSTDVAPAEPDVAFLGRNPHDRNQARTLRPGEKRSLSPPRPLSAPGSLQRAATHVASAPLDWRTFVTTTDSASVVSWVVGAGRPGLQVADAATTSFQEEEVESSAISQPTSHDQHGRVSSSAIRRRTRAKRWLRETFKGLS